MNFKLTLKNIENHAIKILESQQNYGNHGIPFQNLENYENHKFPNENHGNHENHRISSENHKK